MIAKGKDRPLRSKNLQVPVQFLNPQLKLQGYESALVHPHEKHRHSTERHRHSTERPRHSLEHHCLDEEAASVSNSSELDPVYEELHDTTLWQKLGLLFSDLELVVLLVMAVLFGFAKGIIDGYLFIYLDSLGKAFLPCMCKGCRLAHELLNQTSLSISYSLEVMLSVESLSLTILRLGQSAHLHYQCPHPIICINTSR